MVDLGTLGGASSEATAVSNAGQVVGWAQNAAAQVRAVIWSGPWKDLAVNFGPGAGVWALRQTSWIQVNSLSPESMATGDLDGNGLDDLVLDFGTRGRVGLDESRELAVSEPAESDAPGNGRPRQQRKGTRWCSISRAPGCGSGGTTRRGRCCTRSAHDTWLPRTSMAWLGEELIVNFQGGNGLWTLVNNMTWVQLHGFDVTTMIMVDLNNNGSAELIASFPTYGVWVYMYGGAWSLVHSFEAQRMAALHLDGGTQIDLVFDFGAAYGLWTYRNSSVWAQLHPAVSQGLAVGDFTADGKDDLVVGFGGAGLWKYSNGAWSQLHTAGPGGLATGRLH